MKSSKIAWTDHTFNPWWGCARVSPGCRFCYAESFAKRTGHAVWGDEAERRHFGDGHWNEPRKWDREAEAAGRPALVFCASMADVFEDRVDLLEDRFRLFDLIAETPHLVWLLLTKRPENVPWLVPPAWLRPRPFGELLSGWPANVWVGTTVEDHLSAEDRIPRLLELPAPVRFLSCEPLLEAVDLTPWVDRVQTAEGVEYPTGIGWIIAGGESGPRHRPFDVDHARELERIAELSRTPFFFKQHGGLYPGSGGHLLDGRLRWEWPAEAGDRSELVAAALAELETPVDLR